MHDLYDMLSRDPDGWQVEPTDADRERFRTWVVETYGENRYRVYSNTHWDIPTD